MYVQYVQFVLYVRINDDFPRAAKFVHSLLICLFCFVCRHFCFLTRRFLFSQVNL